MREAGGEWVWEHPTGASTSPEPTASSGGGRRREDLRLPSEGGWEWTGDWRLDTRQNGCDADGWQYRSRPGEGGWRLC